MPFALPSKKRRTGQSKEEDINEKTNGDEMPNDADAARHYPLH
jgi:hypothetical protein